MARFDPATGVNVDDSTDLLTDRISDGLSEMMDPLLREYMEAALLRILYLESHPVARKPLAPGYSTRHLVDL